MLNAMAADNLASGATVTVPSNTDNAAKIVDDNIGTSWQAASTTLETDNYFILDLGEAKTFDTFKMLQEGAYAKGYIISTSTDGTTYTTAVTHASATITAGSDGKFTTTDKVAEAITARYIKVQATELALQYGMNVWEFYVYNIGTQTLASLSVANADKADASKTAVKVGEAVAITALDDNNVNIDGGITWSATSGTITDAGVFTPSAKGAATITAEMGSVTKTATVYAYEGDNLLLNKALTCNEGASSTNLFTDGNWGSRGALGNTLPAFATADLGAYYTIDLVDVKQEQAVAKDYAIQFSSDGTTWTDAYTIADEKGMAGDVRHYFYGAENSNVRFIRFYATTAATNYGISIYEIAAYGTKTADIEDSNAPTDFTATLLSSSAISATLQLKATDDVASDITYTIKDEANGINATTTGKKGEAVNYTLSVNPNTTYNFSVTASDGVNSTEAITIELTTPAMPDVPTPTASNTKAIYGTALGNANGYAWANWGGSGGSGSTLKVGEDEVFNISTFTYYGSQFGSIDATDYTTLHLDIYPLQDMTIGIVPIITHDGSNQPEKGLQQSLTAGQWNSLDLALADFGYQYLDGFFQIKYVGGVNKSDGYAADGFSNGAGTESFLVGNVYLIGAEIEDTEAPVMETAEASNIGKTSATLTLKATDNIENGTLTYTVKNGEEQLASATGKAGTDVTVSLTGLTAGTEYTLSVTATDAKSNTSKAKTVTFTTVSASDDSQGSGVASATDTSVNGVAYTYKFTEDSENPGNVTITTTADGTGVEGYVTPTHYSITAPEALEYEATTDTYTWEGLTTGTTITLKLWWAVAAGQSTTEEITYTVKNGKAAPVVVVADTVIISSVGYNTYASQYSLDYTSAEGLTAYTVTTNGTAITLTPVEGVLKAGEPVVLKGTANEKYGIKLAAEDATVLTPDNELLLSDGVEADGTQYVLADGSKGVGFYKVATGTVITAGKAYLVLSSEQAAKADYLSLDGSGDEPTAINAATLLQDSNADRYNLAGQRVAKSYKGIVIVNGKKYVNR